MTEDQYQQLRQFIKLNGRYLKKISPQQLDNLREISNDAKNIRNRIFFNKHQVVRAFRAHERWSTLKTLNYLESSQYELKKVKKEFADFFFKTTGYDTIQSQREKEKLNQNLYD